VVLNTIVGRVEKWETNHIQVCSADGRMYQSKSVIVAVPPLICRTIHFTPQLPIARTHLQQRNLMGSVIKWVVLYETPFWRQAGFSGEVVCDCTEGPVFNVYDDCVLNQDGSEQPALVLFCNGQPAREWSQRTVEERQTGILKQLTKWFGDEASNPVRVLEKNWVDDPWSRGCPVGIWPTGALWAAGHALRQPLGRLYFAGTEAATEHQGFMDGAISSGERAAAEVLLEWGGHSTNTTPLKLPTQRKYREYRYMVAAAVLTLLIVLMLLMANRMMTSESIEN
jgi:monoamine oxidase